MMFVTKVYIYGRRLNKHHLTAKSIYSGQYLLALLFYKQCVEQLFSEPLALHKFHVDLCEIVTVMYEVQQLDSVYKYTSEISGVKLTSIKCYLPKIPSESIAVLLRTLT